MEIRLCADLSKSGGHHGLTTRGFPLKILFQLAFIPLPWGGGRREGQKITYLHLVKI
ncbi:hypothetical protein AGR7B_Cc250058 [Agrobacterium deltaense RV3]|nr:hypothetical protein AGR7B_Cc250058 [Agrobacterium deltaense RV3]